MVSDYVPTDFAIQIPEMPARIALARAIYGRAPVV